MVDKLPTEGYTLSELPQITLPLLPGDMAEVIRARVDNPERFKNFHFNPDPYSLPKATTTKYGVFILGENSTTSDMILAALTDMLSDQILPGSGVTLDYDDGTGILTISAGSGPEPEPLLGTFNLIGRNSSLHVLDVEEGTYYACAPIYDVENDVVTRIVQMPKITNGDLDNGGTEQIRFVPLCVIGPYMVSTQLSQFESTQKMWLTTYTEDETLRDAAAWEAAAIAPTPIDLHYRYTAKDAIVIAANKFGIIATCLDPEPTGVVYFEIVEFVTDTNLTKHTILIDVSLTGSGVLVDTRSPTCAVDFENNEIALVYSGVIYGPETSEYYGVLVVIDTESYTVKSMSAHPTTFEGSRIITPVAGLTAYNSDTFIFYTSDAYYKSAQWECKLRVNFENYNSYGRYVTFYNYESNAVVDDVIDAPRLEREGVDENETEFQPPVNAKLISLGFTPVAYDDGEGNMVVGEQPFGSTGAFMS